jgi:hypothetical protein
MSSDNISGLTLPVKVDLIAKNEKLVYLQAIDYTF